MERLDNDIEKIDGDIDAGLIEELNHYDYSGGQEERQETGLEDAGQKFVRPSEMNEVASGRHLLFLPKRVQPSDKAMAYL